MRAVRIISLFVVFPLILSCGAIRKMGVNMMAPTLQEMTGLGYRQSDLEFMRLSLPGNLFMIEGMLELSPENYTLLTLLAQGYCGYALGFAEDENPEWAKKLFAKGRDLAMKALELNYDFKKSLKEGEKFDVAVKRLGKDYISALFWAGNCWSVWLNLNKTDPRALFDIPKILAIMERVKELDDKFYYGGVHLFYASYYAGLPSIAGGGPEKAQVEFEKFFEISQNKFLLGHVYYAQFYAGLIKDEDLFDKEIDYVLNTPSDIEPNLTLANEIAKKKARNLKKNKDRYF